MNARLRQLARGYASALKIPPGAEPEAALAEAYELGRKAASRGLGVLDMARACEHAMEMSVWPRALKEGSSAILSAAHAFFLESLSPFEVTHRGFRETNARLQQLNAALTKRNAQLADTNRRLEAEIVERKRTEKALTESKEHFEALFAEARRMEEQLRNLSHEVLHVQEEERKRISRELHDDVGQALMAVSVTLAPLKREGPMEEEFRLKKVADAHALLRETMDSVHRFARELRPSMLDELGLLPALRSYLKGFSERTCLPVRFRADESAENLDGTRKTVLFRIAQESLTNVAKHARATRASVIIRSVKEGIQMEIADNGRSFSGNDLNSSSDRQRLGLLGMQERVRLVDGRFSIRPVPGRGTTVKVLLSFGPPARLAKTVEADFANPKPPARRKRSRKS